MLSTFVPYETMVSSAVELYNALLLRAPAVIQAAPPTIEVKHVGCGRFKPKRNHIVLPAWLWQGGDRCPKEWNKPGYCEYYIAHELAHAIAGPDANHGAEFQKVLAWLTPNFHHFEVAYKPKLYAAHYKRMVQRAQA